jgi:hypothetical protein
MCTSTQSRQLTCRPNGDVGRAGVFDVLSTTVPPSTASTGFASRLTYQQAQNEGESIAKYHTVLNFKKRCNPGPDDNDTTLGETRQYVP